MATPSTPSFTVYIRNLEERIKLDTLKETLREMFEEYGDILEIRAAKNIKAKGQAFVVFDSTDSAGRAIEELQDFEVFGKPMKLDYARTRSDATVRRNGTEEDFEAHKRRRLAEKDRKQALEKQEAQKKLKRPAGAPAESNRPAQKARGAGLKATGGATVIPDQYLPPNKILFVQNLPDGHGVETLSAIFGRFEGFREVRTVPGRSGIAFVEYEAEVGAISAKEATAEMAIGDEGQPMKVTYQRQ